MRITRITAGLPKVIVLHCEALIGDALEVILRGRSEVIARTASGKSAVALSELLAPDVVVVGEFLADGVAEYFIKPLLQSGAHVLLVCGDKDTSQLLEFVKLGVSGIVEVGDTPTDLGHAVNILAGGGAIFPPDVTAYISTDWRRSKTMDADTFQNSNLTARELEVLSAMSDGMSTKAVAHHLGISLKTVENHKTRIFNKLGVRSQAQAVAVVINSEPQGATSSTGMSVS
jgi:DNA-binding NarL/FixJ family response regulator